MSVIYEQVIRDPPESGDSEGYRTLSCLPGLASKRRTRTRGTGLFRAYGAQVLWLSRPALKRGAIT